MSKPFLNVVAGPNGSGKTTLTNKFRQSGIEIGMYINADDLALGLTGNPSEIALAAQSLAEKAREKALSANESLTFETVMSHGSKIEFMRRASHAGYEVKLFFVSTDSPFVNIQRVKSRVLLGGHDVPERKIYERYYRTMNLLADAVSVSNSGALFDNTAPVSVDGAKTARPLQIILTFGRDFLGLTHRIKTDHIPRWVNISFIDRIAYINEKTPDSAKVSATVHTLRQVTRKADSQ